MAITPPIIDITGLFTGTNEGEVIAAIAGACRRWGFFQVVGHNIPRRRLDKVWEYTRAFFALPRESKVALMRSKDNPRGYYDRELTKNKRDLKEILDFGQVPRPDLPAGAPENYSAIDGVNQWPEEMPEFRTVMIQHLRDCEVLGFKLMEAFCLGLGAPRDRLRQAFEPVHTSFARLNYYPLQDPLAGDDAAIATASKLGDMALEHHTDAGILTVLLQDDVGGLQCRADGEWFDIAPVDGAIVINIGDMMQVWSNDRYLAAVHRVRPMRGRERFSVPYFFNPSYDADCIPLESLVVDEPARYRPINWGHFRQLRAYGDFADYGKEVQLDDFRI